MVELLDAFKPITLEEMKSVKLMNRTDTKFVTNTRKLSQLLEMAQQDYYVQDISGQRNLDYDTTYFDTTAFDMYTQHQCGHLNRQKIRFRTYCISDLQFMEVKTKNNHGRTKKKRIEVQPGTDIIHDPEASAFLAERQPYPVESLIPNLETAFDRFTLVNYEKTERLTIDCNLTFNNFVSGTSASMDSLVIMELKQDGRAHSLLKEVLFDLRIKPYKLSKYCIGTAMTRPEVKQNRFKKKLRRINKLKTLNCKL